MPDDLWSGPGQRAWQYAGQFDGKPCRVLGLDVDINVADPGCLAFAPGRSARATGSSRSGSLRRGDRGSAVERLTRRLTYLRYLDGARTTFDRATESAVSRFQQDHGLEPRGRYGPRTTRKLKSAVAAQRERRRTRRRPSRAPAGFRGSWTAH
jgi:peptidoglycan hydrolase-like protein with peptidoglycan-binding domain